MKARRRVNGQMSRSHTIVANSGDKSIRPKEYDPLKRGQWLSTAIYVVAEKGRCVRFTNRIVDEQ